MKNLQVSLAAFKKRKAAEKVEAVKAFELQDAKMKKHLISINPRNAELHGDAGTSNDAKGEKKKRENEKVRSILL